MNVKKILVIQPLPGIGDTVWFLPHLHALSKRGEITLLTKKNSQAPLVLQADPHIKHIMYVYRNPGLHDGVLGFWKLASLMRQGQFTEAWILHNSPRYAYAAKVAGIPHVYTYGTGLTNVFNEGHIKLSPDIMASHPIDRAKELLVQGGIPMGRSLEYELYLDPESFKSLHEHFAAHRKPWVAFGIGSSEAYKKWTLARWADLANSMTEKYKCHIFLLAGPAEIPDAETILSLLTPEARKHVTAVNTLPLAQSMAMAKTVNLFIGNDTGMLNVAAAAGTKAYGLFQCNKIMRYTNNLIPVLPLDGKEVYTVQDLTVQDVLDSIQTHFTI